MLKFSTHSRRVRKIWYSILATILGTVFLVSLIIWQARQFDTDLGDPTAGITASAKTEPTLDSPPIRFQDVAQAMGLPDNSKPDKRKRLLPEDTGSGLAWGDYDGDGDWDLYVVHFPTSASTGPSSPNSNRLYRNDAGRFTDVTETAGVGDAQGFGMGASFADFNHDGAVDLYVTNWGPNRLFRNRGDGTFEEIAEQAGVADPQWSTGIAWGDYDRDGDLDLYVCNYVDYDLSDLDLEQLPEAEFGTHTVPFTLNPNSFDPAPNRLYQNRGDGTFVEVAKSQGVSNPTGRSLTATFCDLDGDGWLDLYVNNDVSTNKLFRNMLGDLQSDRGTDSIAFTDLSSITGTADPRGSMGLSVGELGRMNGKPDGLPDLFITHWVAQENAFYQSLRMPGGSLEYRDKTRQFRLGEISIDTVGWGTALIDLDLDGRTDLVVANGSTLEQPDQPAELIAEPIFLFWNSGNRFQNVAASAGQTAAGKHSARGLAAADFDDDGDIDLAIAINRSGPLLLRNETPTANHFLKIRLRGSAAVRFGASVEIFTGEKSQKIWYGADASFLSMHAPELIFGLGTETSVDRLLVEWADGKQSTLRQLEPGRVEVVHPEAAAQDRELSQNQE